MVEISASLLAANPLHLQAEIKSVSELVDRLHIDVMDGHFVPNLALSTSTIQAIPEQMRRDVHLMVTNPEEVVRWLHIRATDTVYFHPQATLDCRALIDTITGLGAEAGFAITLDYDLEQNLALLSNVHSFLVMGVKPGFSGQAFNDVALSKISWLRQHFPEVSIAVDGGVNAANAGKIISVGANVLVTGDYLFQAKDKADAVAVLKLKA